MGWVRPWPHKRDRWGDGRDPSARQMGWPRPWARLKDDDQMRDNNRLKFNKLILLLLAIWPLVYSVLFMIVLLPGSFSEWSNYDVGLAIVLLGHVATSAIALAGITLFLLNLYHNRKLHRNRKMLWTLGILFLSPVSLLMYWWKFVRIEQVR